jgi:hypothetical protein
MARYALCGLHTCIIDRFLCERLSECELILMRHEQQLAARQEEGSYAWPTCGFSHHIYMV